MRVWGFAMFGCALKFAGPVNPANRANLTTVPT
jgi:hypothetical protein